MWLIYVPAVEWIDMIIDHKRIARNTYANFGGGVIKRLIPIVLVPLQINLLGEQAFGLLGIYALFGSLAIILDFGLSITARREVARIQSVRNYEAQDLRDLIRTFELPYWLIGLLLGTIVLFSASWLADNWIIAPGLSRNTVVFAIFASGFMLVVRWPASLYKGILFGMQRQVEVNILSAAIDIFGGVGAITLLLLWPDIKVFFIWQLLMDTTEICGYLLLSWHAAGRCDGDPPRFRLSILKGVWRYALGVNLSSVSTTLFSRMDGLILSKLVPIHHFGFYSIAQRVPSLTGLFSGAILPATSPVMAGLYERKDYAELRRIYHRQTRWLAFLSVGFTFPLAAYSYQVLRIWTQNSKVAEETALALSIIAAASALEITSNSVNQLSLFTGFTRPPIVVSLVEGAIVAVGTLILAPVFGINGAATAFGLSRLVRFFLMPVLAHRLVLEKESRQWFLSTAPVFVAGFICVGSGRLLHQHLFGMTELIYWIPIMLVTLGCYVGGMILLNMIPEWKKLPIIAQIPEMLSKRYLS
jgi:O-antigen/teichoic acid export membrane protein